MVNASISTPDSVNTSFRNIRAARNLHVFIFCDLVQNSFVISLWLYSKKGVVYKRVESGCKTIHGIASLCIFFFSSRGLLLFFYLFFFFFYFTILYWFCHISAWIRHRCTHVPNPESLSHLPPIPSLWVIPVHQPRASCIMHRTWTGDSFHIW